MANLLQLVAKPKFAYYFHLLHNVFTVMLKQSCLIFLEGSSTSVSRNSRISDRKSVLFLITPYNYTSGQKKNYPHSKNKE